MSPPRVSVLMVTYCNATYLDEAIASVLAQTMADLELIAIDDGSPDETPAILARHADRDPRVVVHRQENRGIGGAMNKALALARSDYVAILDGDDAMEPERLGIQADYLDQHPEIAAVGSQWYTMDTRSRINGLDRHPTDTGSVADLMFAYFAMHHPTIMARKAAIFASGLYDSVKRQGCRDYEVFVNVLLSNYQLINLPQVLTRWRLNPAGVTHGKARPQTEDCMDIRWQAFARLAERDCETADRVAEALVRNFPAGSWFDAKVAKLVPAADAAPALNRWRELAARGRIPAIEAQAVDWLHGERDHANGLAGVLEQAGLPWLAQLVLAKAGRLVPSTVALGTSESAGALHGIKRCMTVLVPTAADDDDLSDRLRSVLGSMPDDAEALVFSTDGSTLDEHAWMHDARLRALRSGHHAANAWVAACAEARGRHVAWLESGHRHHPDFLARSLGVLDSNGGINMTYAVSDIYFPDALDLKGQPVKDPAPEPRWSKGTLLGKDRARLSCMVIRREILGSLRVDPREAGRMTGWAMARCLLLQQQPHLLEMRNIEYAPPIRLANNIMATLTHRLLLWYLDNGLGSIPSDYAWPDLPAEEVRQRLSRLDAQLGEGNLYVHPGNLPSVLHFVTHFSPLPLASASFRHILRGHPREALNALRQHGIVQISLAVAWCTAYRLWRKLASWKPTWNTARR